MKRTFPISTLLLLLGIFFVSILVRLPNINRPLSKHHEFVTAVALRTIDIWQQEGALTYAFNPVMNYPGKANKNINNWASTTGNMKDVQGNYYYVSHPPFAYILPYLVFKLLHINANVLSIQLFHLCIHLLSGLFVYLIICLLGQQKPFFKPYWSGIVGFIVYLFNPATMWFQCNTYMSDMLVQLFFIANVYILLKLLMRKRFFSPKYLIWYGILLFFMVYTSWLGIFFAFSVFLYSFVKLRKERVFFPLNLITLLVPAAALLLFIYQSSFIAGKEVFFEQLLQRLSERGSMHNHQGITQSILAYFKSLITILINHIYSYLPLFLLLLSFIYLSLTEKKMRIVFTKNGYRFLWLSTLPVILLNLSLSNYAGHDFVSLYSSLFLSVLIAILYDKLKTAKTLKPIVLNTGIGILVVFSIGIYFYINKPGKYSFKGDYYALSKDLGTQINKNTLTDAVVFTEGDAVIDPQLIYYAQRNIVKVKNEYEAIQYLKTQNFSNGMLFKFSSAKDEYQFYEMKALQINE